MTFPFVKKTRPLLSLSFNSNPLTSTTRAPCPTSASSYLCSTKKKACARSWNKSAACSPPRTVPTKSSSSTTAAPTGQSPYWKTCTTPTPKSKSSNFGATLAKPRLIPPDFNAHAAHISITMDADLQDDPAEIPNLLSKIEEGYDLVSGWKKKRFDPLGKTLPSKFFNWVTGFVSGIDIHDFNCGLKIYRSEVTKDLCVLGELHRYIPVLAHMEGYRIGEIPVQHHPRQYGVTKYGWGRLLKGFLDLLTVMYIGKYMGRPLHLFGTVGLIFGTIGMLINAYIASLWLQTGTIQYRYPLLMLGVFLTVLGVQFVCTGLLADMLTRGPQPNEKFNIRKILE